MEHIWEWVSELQTYSSCIHFPHFSDFYPICWERTPTTCGYFFCAPWAQCFPRTCRYCTFFLTHVSAAFSLDETQFVRVSGHVWWTKALFILYPVDRYPANDNVLHMFSFNSSPTDSEKLRFHHSCVCKRTAMVAGIATPRRHDPAKIAAKCLELYKCYHLACRHGSNQRRVGDFVLFFSILSDVFLRLSLCVCFYMMFKAWVQM